MSQNQTQIELFVYGRLSYCFAHQPQEGKNDKGEVTKTYGTHVLIDPKALAEPTLGLKSGADYLQAIRDAQRQVATAAWPRNTVEVLTELAHKDRLALKEGNKSKATDPNYKDLMFVSANAKARPTLVETRGGKIVQLVESDNRPYSGCWAVVKIAVWAQGADGKQSDYGKRINVQLQGIQFVKHDTAFGGGGRVAQMDEFAPINAAEADAPAPAAASAGSSLF